MQANISEKPFENKTILVTGGTGSLGKVLIKRLLAGADGIPKKVIVFSRDEAKQHFMRLEFLKRADATDESIYSNFSRMLEFRIGDVRDYPVLLAAVRDADIVVNAAALKQVPSCEYFPFEAVETNVRGAENIVRAVREYGARVETVVGVSTDKACNPVNVMGMTKAIQERIFAAANIRSRSTRFVNVRYGNVLASRGSVIPLFHDQIRSGGPVTITTKAMTRFLLPLNRAVDLIAAALRYGRPGETFVPRIPTTRILTLAQALIGDRSVAINETGIRPGEKVHEIMVTEEEAPRTRKAGEFYAITPMLPELLDGAPEGSDLKGEYSSEFDLMDLEGTTAYLEENQMLVDQAAADGFEVLR